MASIHRALTLRGIDRLPEHRRRPVRRDLFVQRQQRGRVRLLGVVRDVLIERKQRPLFLERISPPPLLRLLIVVVLPRLVGERYVIVQSAVGRVGQFHRLPQPSEQGRYREVPIGRGELRA